jgi:DNA ligase 1
LRAFSELFEELDTTTATNLKVAAMVRYFRAAPPADAAWAAYILSGRRLKRFIGPTLLYRWLTEAAALPEWLIDESAAAVGDMAETIALLMETDGNGAPATDVPLAEWIDARLLPLREAPVEEQRTAIVNWWRTLPYRECFLLNKLLTGELRVGVSALLVTRAIAETVEMPRPDIARRLMGEWLPGKEFWEGLAAPGNATTSASAPYPFFLASPLEGDPHALGAPSDWQIEWKWDGIRAQLIRRCDQYFIWSRGEDLITERFPELASLGAALGDGSVIDGEILAWEPGGDAPLPFARLQPRITRKTVSQKVLADSPATFLAYDLLEADGIDLRTTPLDQRRARLDELAGSLGRTLAVDLLRVSPEVRADDWHALGKLRDESRERGVEGLMLKGRESMYGVGRTKASGTWWKWKVDPYAVDAVLVYAQRGHGRRASLYTDFTFAVWDEANGVRTLVPFAKAYSGLTDEEMRQVDAIVRKTTIEKFGPVRSVTPTLVFEIGFEGIQTSPRHKSGVAVRFPRMLRWRTDKQIDDADTLAMLKGFIDDPAG